jgi:hypothetical protein
MLRMRSNPHASKAALHGAHDRFHGFAMNFGVVRALRCSNVVFAGCNVANRDLI